MTGAQIVRITANAFIILLFIAGGVIGILRWTRGLFSVRRFLLCAGLLLLLNGGELANNWLIITSRFQTSAPFALQVGTTLLGALLVLIVVSGAMGLNVGLVHLWIPLQPVGDRSRAIVSGVGLGAVIAGLGALVSWLAPDTAPSWASYQNAGAYVPLLAAAIEPVGRWIVQTALLLLVFSAAQAWSRGWSRRRVPLALLIALTGLALAAGESVESLPLWLVTGSVTGVVLLTAYVLVLRRHLALLPVMTATVAVLAVLQEGSLRAFFGAFVGSLAGAVIIAVLAWLWFRWLTADSRPGASTEVVASGQAPTPI